MLAAPKSVDLRIFGGTFGAAVPRPVIVVAVLVVFPIGLIVFIVVGDQIRQGISVMRGDEIDTRLGPFPVPLIEVRGTGQPISHFPGLAFVAFPIAAYRVAVFAVPFRPEYREITDLIAAFSDIPRFRDKFDLRKHRVLMNDVKKCGEFTNRVQLPARVAAKSKRKPSTCISVTQYRKTIHDQLQGARLASR